MEVVLEIVKIPIHRNFIEDLGLRKVNSRFVPHRLTNDQELYRIEHCTDIVREVKKKSC